MQKLREPPLQGGVLLPPSHGALLKRIRMCVVDGAREGNECTKCYQKKAFHICKFSSKVKLTAKPKTELFYLSRIRPGDVLSGTQSQAGDGGVGIGLVIHAWWVRRAVDRR